MSPIGHGLNQSGQALPFNTFRPSYKRSYNSLWTAGHDAFFRDPRASRAGDVLTVLIAIDDRATLDNRSDRARSGSANLGGGFSASLDDSSTEGEASGDIAANSRSRGQGSIDRKEEIKLSVAAVVTNVLPNGNLVISGSQEVRVNYEMRVLNIAGIVRPRDIASDNTITYEKIAEARISYGGRGRISEVQQPGWGQQVYDFIAPF